MIEQRMKTPDNFIALDLRHVRTFVHVSDTGSINRAAPELGYSQLGLSQGIQIFERALRHRVFIRRPPGVGLTTAGGLALPYGRIVLTVIDQLRDDIRKDGPSAERS
jgi:LysR family transcriptional regulator, benzoate and cis,cis-muconate-responsive activator of ben and cat genes